ncbi:hypothetical protein [Oceanobacillus rekensis]|nr:hypothetical protein [Oceanobacillus rekensis]
MLFQFGIFLVTNINNSCNSYRCCHQ